jgi:hypothetical protein
VTDPRPIDLLDDVVTQFGRMSVPDPPPDADVLAKFVRREAEFRPLVSQASLRTIFMRPVVGYGAAVALLLASVAWLISSSSTSFALADVIKAAERHKLVRYKLKQTTDDKINGHGEAVSTAYADLKAPRFRTETGGKTFNGVLEYKSVSVQDNQANRLLSLLTQTLLVAEKDAKDAAEAEMIRLASGHVKKEARIGLISSDDKSFPDRTPLGRSFLENLRALENRKETVATRTQLDGRDVMKYVLEEDKKKSVLHVDARTKLPLRIEYEFTDPTLRIAKNTFVYSDFEWDPDAKDLQTLFSTVPPAGFAVEDDTKSK